MRVTDEDRIRTAMEKILYELAVGNTGKQDALDDLKGLVNLCNVKLNILLELNHLGYLEETEFRALANLKMEILEEIGSLY